MMIKKLPYQLVTRSIRTRINEYVNRERSLRSERMSMLFRIVLLQFASLLYACVNGDRVVLVYKRVNLQVCSCVVVRVLLLYVQTT